MTRGTLSALVLFATSLVGCKTVEFTVANLDAPVLVGPVRPSPTPGSTVRKTQVNETAIDITVVAGSGRTSGGGSVRGQHADQSDSAAVFDLALDNPVGDCFGCWVLVDGIDFSTYYHLTMFFASWAKVEADFEVVHPIGEPDP